MAGVFPRWGRWSGKIKSESTTEERRGDDHAEDYIQEIWKISIKK